MKSCSAGCLMFFIGMVILGIAVKLFECMFYLIVAAGYILGILLVIWIAKEIYEKITS